jgi:hypothetical protein
MLPQAEGTIRRMKMHARGGVTTGYCIFRVVTHDDFSSPPGMKISPKRLFSEERNITTYLATADMSRARFTAKL